MEIIIRSMVGNVLVAAVIGIVAILLRKHVRPSVTHALWILVLLKLVAPPVFFAEIPRFFAEDVTSATQELPETSDANSYATTEAAEGLFTETKVPTVLAEETPTAIPTPPIESPSAAEITSADVAEAPTIAESLLYYVPAIWAIGAVLVLGLAFFRSQKFRRLLATSEAPSRRVTIILADLARRFGLARTPSVVVVRAPIPPLLWGRFGSPCIVLPGSLIERLDDDALRTLLAHELAHYARKDHWVRYLEIFVAAAYWWLPILPLFRRELRRTEEECCDAWVVGVLPTDAQAYAHALLATVDFVAETPSALPIGVSGMGAFDMLKRRLTMILVGSSEYRLRSRGRGLLIVLALLALPFAPAWAQERETFPETRRFIRELEEKRDQAAESGRERIAEALTVEIRALKDFLAQKDGAQKRSARRGGERATEERRYYSDLIERRADPESSTVEDSKPEQSVENLNKLKREFDERRVLVEAEMHKRRADVEATLLEREADLRKSLDARRAEMQAKEKLLVDLAEQYKHQASEMNERAIDLRNAEADLKVKVAAEQAAEARAKAEISRMESNIAVARKDLKSVEEGLAKEPSDDLKKKHAELAAEIDAASANLERMRESWAKRRTDNENVRKAFLKDRAESLRYAEANRLDAARKMETDLRLEQSKMRQDTMRIEQELRRFAQARDQELNRLNAERDRNLQRLEEERVRLRRDAERNSNRLIEERRARENQENGGRRRPRNEKNRGASSGYRADSGQRDDANPFDQGGANNLTGTVGQGAGTLGADSVGSGGGVGSGEVDSGGPGANDCNGGATGLGMGMGGAPSSGSGGALGDGGNALSGTVESSWVGSSGSPSGFGGMSGNDVSTFSGSIASTWVGAGPGGSGRSSVGVDSTTPGAGGPGTPSSGSASGMGPSSTTKSGGSGAVLVLEDEAYRSATGVGSPNPKSPEGVPVLKDIPIVGDLFKKESKSAGVGESGATDKKAREAAILKMKKAELEEAIKKLEAEIEAIATGGSSGR